MRADHFIVDGRNLLYRTADAFNVLSAEVNGEEIAVGGLYGFLSVLSKIHRRYGGRVYVAWEGKRSRNFRRELFPDYKKRAEPDEDTRLFLDSMIDQERRLKAVLRAIGVRQYLGANCEADDVMAKLATRLDGRRIIYTGDSDLRQLVAPPGIIVVSPGFRGQDKAYDTEASVSDKHGVPPRLLADLKALAGDASDGIPGVRGIGPKIASKLLLELGSLKNVLRAALGPPEGWPSTPLKQKIIAEAARDVVLYRKLTGLWTERARMKQIKPRRDRDMAFAHLRAYQFKSLMQPSEMFDLMRLGRG